MNKANLTLEELVCRWEDRREIQNIMGRYTYDLLMKREKDIFATYWCQQAPDPCLGVNEGYYQAMRPCGAITRPGTRKICCAPG